MKILQINCVYPNGSTGKIVKCLHDAYLKKGYASIVCYGRGKKIKENGVYKISSELEAKIHSVQARLFGVEFAHSPIATNKAITIIKQEQPDVVHLHCLNGHFINVYRLLEYLKSKRVKTVLTLHAEIMHTAGCEHAYECEKWKQECQNCQKVRGKISRYFRDDATYCFRRMKRAVAGFDELTVVGVSQWLTDRAKLSPIFENCQFTTVQNGLDQNVFFLKNTDTLQKKYNYVTDKKIVLHVTPNFNAPIKGGKFVIEMAKRMPDVQFIVVGYNGDNARLPKNMITVAHTTDQDELAQYYSMANVTLLTSKKETFSMVCAESLSCGTPVVAFKAGAPETISLPDYSEFVEYGNVDELQKCLEKWLKRNDLNKEQISTKAKEIYSAETMVAGYIEAYKDIQ